MSGKRIAQVRFFTYADDKGIWPLMDVIFDDGTIVTVDSIYYDEAKRLGISLIELLKRDGKI